MRVPLHPTIYETFARSWTSKGPSIASPLGNSLQQQSRKMASTQQSTADIDVQTKDVNTAPGVQLNEQQRLLTTSVMDLFVGQPSLKKLQLWKDDGVFEDPLTVAKGRHQYEAQWYGLKAAFSEIERLSHTVVSSGNPITMDLRTRYKMKGVGKEQTIDSKIKIFYDEKDGKISKVEDRWNDELPEGGFKNAFRKLNAVTVPKMVGVPKSEEEDSKS